MGVIVGLAMITLIECKNVESTCANPIDGMRFAPPMTVECMAKEHASHTLGRQGRQIVAAKNEAVVRRKLNGLSLETFVGRKG